MTAEAATVTKEARQALHRLSIHSVECLESLESDGVIVTQVQCAPGLSRDAIRSWEKDQDVVLPDDATRFFRRADGFDIKWKASLCKQEHRPIGHMAIPGLSSMTVIHEYVDAEQDTELQSAGSEPLLPSNQHQQPGSWNVASGESALRCLAPDPTSHPQQPCIDCFMRQNVMIRALRPAGGSYSLRSVLATAEEVQGRQDSLISSDRCYTDEVAALCPDGKLKWLALAQIADVGRVVMDCCPRRQHVFKNETHGHVWLVEERNGRMHRVTTSFSNYVCLVNVHLGIPYWQLLLTNVPPPAFAMFWFSRFIPDRLRIDQEGDDIPDVEEVHTDIDPSLFERMPARSQSSRHGKAKTSEAV